jgi:integrase
MSISRKNKRWYVQIDVPAGPDGKRRRRGVGGFKTKREAKAAEAEALRRLKEQTFVEPSRVLVREYLTTWLAGMANQVRPTTLDGYRHQVRVHLLPISGTSGSSSSPPPPPPPPVSTSSTRSWPSGGGKDGQPLAPKTVRLAHTVIRRALRDAMADGLVARNVAAQARPPRARPVEMRTWTAEEVGAFLASVREHRLYGAWLLLATLGLRRGELVGLRWQDVDLNAGRIAVRRTLVMVSGKPALAEPKTAKGRRSITFAPDVADALRRHRTQQAAERLAWGAGWTDSGLVVTCGRPPHAPRDVQRHLHPPGRSRRPAAHPAA